MQVKIVRKTTLAVNISAFELMRCDGAPLPAFSAGAHIDVKLRSGLIRQYSLCNDPSETHRYLIAVLRVPASRGGSEAIHALQEGDILEIGFPKNHFQLADDSSYSLLLAGGIGVTPIISMAEVLAVNGAGFEMHYCSRDEEHMAFRDHLLRSEFSDRVRLYFDSAPSDGRIDLALILSEPTPKKHLYVCGPEGFISAVVELAKKFDWEDHCIHREFFAMSAPVLPEGSSNFKVKLSSSGRIFEIPNDKTVVEVLAQAGIEIPISCNQGVCGTCVTGVLSGEPDHRDFYLTDDEKELNNQFTPCCSRSKSDTLILDL
jgi:vanillate O-demethylase ferredoxin subunit